MKTKQFIFALALIGLGSTMSAQNWTTSYEDGLPTVVSGGSCKPLDMDNSASLGFVAGQFNGTVTIGATTLSSSGSSDAFLSRAANTGSAWAVKAGGAGTDAFKKVIYAGGNIIVYGSHTGAITFYGTSGSPVVHPGSGDFLAMYNSAGVFQWVVPYTDGVIEDMSFTSPYLYTIANLTSSPSTKIVVKSFSISSTTATNILNIVSTNTAYSKASGIGSDNGNFYFLVDATTNFQMPTSPLITITGQDMVMMKFNSAGTWQWSNKIGNPGTTNEFGVDLDCSSTDIYITGYYALGTTYMDPLSTTTNILTNSGGTDLFVAKYNNSGIIQWSNKIGGPDNDIPVEMDLFNGPVIAATINSHLANASVSFVAPACPVTYTFTKPNNRWYGVKFNTSGVIDFADAPENVQSSTSLPVGITSALNTTFFVVGNNDGLSDFSGTVVGNGGFYYAKATKLACKPSVQTGMEEAHETNELFSVYPNPGTGVFTIDAEAFAGGQIDVYDISGKKVQSITLDGGVSSKTLDLTGNSKGVYLLNLSFEGKSYSKKLILE